MLAPTPVGGGNLERISSIDSTSLAFFSDPDKDRDREEREREGEGEQSRDPHLPNISQMPAPTSAPLYSQAGVESNFSSSSSSAGVNNSLRRMTSIYPYGDSVVNTHAQVVDSIFHSYSISFFSEFYHLTLIIANIFLNISESALHN